MGFPDDVHQIAVMLTRIGTKYLEGAGGGNSDMGGVNIYPGDTGVFITSVLKHCTIDVILQTDVSVMEQELIPCPENKRILVLGGRVGSREKVWLTILNGDPAGTLPPNGEPIQLDRAYFPVTNYVLPPSNVNLPHYMTSPGFGLFIRTTTLTADSAERTLSGFLKYVLMDV